ncbi:hypothetical protein ACUXV3_10135 [Roseobacteraceae bacterium NS-SX3]
MMEYTANTEVKAAIARAHAERGQALKAVWTWLFRSRRTRGFRPQVSRWA